MLADLLQTLSLLTLETGREKQALAFVTIDTKWRSFMTEGTQERGNEVLFGTKGI